MEKEIQIVRENIRKACERSGRKPEEVLLIGVSKTKPYAAVQEAYSYWYSGLWREQGTGNSG